ncbi:hypothetical protein C4K68_07755 [Pokkaliibacter plantistimulans]|uniref:Head decoration protein n=1 Tax=Proteobacteria bacterium 228 TaxID=2083153 RepID=A0A2S5KTE3_9PROT|nr:head decoration protein [Pokkaliibacter plantistimulans]PPC77932.1 hypothetical protein C4K68_07755 [Pokkaliibacter plantistimulans]
MLAGSSIETMPTGTLWLGGTTHTSIGTLASGQNLLAATVLGRITTSGELVQAVMTATDGSQTPVGILIHDIDATSAATPCQFYDGGDFDATLVQWDASWTDAAKAGAFDRTRINLLTPR